MNTFRSLWYKLLMRVVVAATTAATTASTTVTDHQAFASTQLTTRILLMVIDRRSFGVAMFVVVVHHRFCTVEWTNRR